MQFTQAHDISGTSLVGYITTTRKHIESVFGKPSWDKPSWDGKVTTEWDIEFADGTVATIYDWKRYEEGAPAYEETYEWHIGGKDFETAKLVSEELAIGVGNFSTQS